MVVLQGHEKPTDIHWHPIIVPAREAGSKHLVERSNRAAASRDAGRIVFITYIPAYAGIFIIIYTIIMYNNV